MNYLSRLSMMLATASTLVSCSQSGADNVHFDYSQLPLKPDSVTQKTIENGVYETRRIKEFRTQHPEFDRDFGQMQVEVAQDSIYSKGYNVEKAKTDSGDVYVVQKLIP